MSNISLADLSVDDVIKLMGQLKAAQKAERSAASKRRAAAREYLTTIVPATIDAFPMRPMGEVGVIGTSLGGTVKVIDPATGEEREARVTMSVRWLDTIPAREKKEADAADAAEDAAEDAAATAHRA